MISWGSWGTKEKVCPPRNVMDVTNAFRKENNEPSIEMTVCQNHIDVARQIPNSTFQYIVLNDVR